MLGQLAHRLSSSSGRACSMLVYWRPGRQRSLWFAAGADGLRSGDLYACRADHPLLARTRSG
ncbi:hypothetical protein [Halomonas citrativorans]|uniref:hypothetical protein n=1 Tax=Halomonas citrativorans TaxID=2742612 RepID=UPI000B34C202|nr:hypothetical protein [Halomonas citrativorans]